MQKTMVFESNVFKMWHTTIDGSQLKIAYATSEDGIIWNNSSIISIPDGSSIHDPDIIDISGSRYLYYAANEQVLKRAKAATDADFQNVQSLAIDRTFWNAESLSCPNLYFSNGTYYLFYCGRDIGGYGGYKIGLATSEDGITFANCQVNPILSDRNTGNSVVVEKLNKLYLYFHSNNGIERMETGKPLSCNSLWTNREIVIAKDAPYDNQQIISPSYIEAKENTHIFYTGRGTEWKLNMATAPMKKLLVVMPGFFGSWNKDALLHNLPVASDQWKIPYFVKEYNGLLKSLENSGYQNGVDYVIFSYDWRKSASSSADELHDFLTTNFLKNNPDTELNFIGHSFGGLIARIYVQKHNIDNIKKVITVGTSNKGIIQAYKPLSGGTIEREDTLIWLGLTALTALYGDFFTPRREFYSQMIPSLYDLFPTFNFIIKKKQEIDIGSMSIQNQLLNAFNPTISNLSNKLINIVGEKDSKTPSKYVVKNTGILGQVNGNWNDGIPIRTINDIGDYLVLSKSSKIESINSETFQFDHSELVTEKDSIKKMFDLLQIPYQESQIEKGEKTQVNPLLIFFVQSPVDVEVKIDDKVYGEEDGVIYISYPPSGTYELHITGNDLGPYRVTTGQVGDKNYVWERIEGEIVEDTPLQQTDVYIIDYNKSKPKAQFSQKNQICKKFRKKGRKRYRWYYRRKNNNCVNNL